MTITAYIAPIAAGVANTSKNTVRVTLIGEIQMPPPNSKPDLNSIKHLVVLMMENRSFDHYLGALRFDHTYLHSQIVEGLPSPLPSNPDRLTTQVQSQSLDGVFGGYVDPFHGPIPQEGNYNGGQMDGFVLNYQNSLEAAGKSPSDVVTQAGIAMDFYTRATLPVHYALADNFTVCDHWFSSMLSSTWPNRKYYLSGERDSDNDTHTIPPWPGFQTVPFLNQLEETFDVNGNPLTWKSYFCDLPFLSFWYKFAASHLRNFSPIDQFVADCRENALPTVSILDPAFSLADDHPSHDVRLGQKFIGLVVDALTHSASWDSTALIITYDENGGFYDHVRPPASFEPNAVDSPLGFRVPTIVVSPYSGSAVCKTTFDHTSIMASVAERWGIKFDPAEYGSRWAQAPTIWESCFNFNADPLPAGLYTPVATGPQGFASLSWESIATTLIEAGIGDLEALLSRIFLLPGLKSLDRRASVLDSLNALETGVRSLKRML